MKENSLTKGNLISFSNIDQVTEGDIYNSKNMGTFFKFKNSCEDQMELEGGKLSIES